MKIQASYRFKFLPEVCTENRGEQKLESAERNDLCQANNIKSLLVNVAGLLIDSLSDLISSSI